MAQRDLFGGAEIDTAGIDELKQRPNIVERNPSWPSAHFRHVSPLHVHGGHGNMGDDAALQWLVGFAGMIATIIASLNVNRQIDFVKG